MHAAIRFRFFKPLATDLFEKIPPYGTDLILSVCMEWQILRKNSKWKQINSRSKEKQITNT